MRYLFIFFIVVTQVSCKKDIDPPSVLPVEAVSFTNTAYGSATRQVMDIYLPENRNANITTTIVVIHGGSWTGGDKAEMTPVIDSLKKRLPQYAFINLNYRLAFNNSVNVFPAQEDDIKSAIASYLSKSKEYKVSKELVLVGASAGAHLALLHSYKNDPEKHVKTVVDFFGPTDLVAAWNDGLLVQLILYGAIGQTYDQNPQIYIQSSPVNFITTKSPPTIALQGGQDFVVLPSQSNLLINKLNSVGIPNQFVFYPEDGHGFSATNYLDAYNKIEEFIKLHVK